MSEISKKFLVILVSILLLAVLFALPGFAETQEELKAVFLTREEWDKWFNRDCGETNIEGSSIGMSQYLNDIALVNQQSIQVDMDIAMSIRGIPRESSEPTFAPTPTPTP